MNALILLILQVIDLYRYVLIATIVMSWLVSFKIINYSNPIVRQVDHVLRALTEPLLAPIRKVIPYIGGLDFSPIVLFLGLQFAQRLLIEYALR